VGALARVFEAAGIATIGISLIRDSAERIKAPRFLHCEFPLGRPLGKPGDAEFQKTVIRAAFDLLARNDVPVLEDFDEVIEDEGSEAMTCALPPRLDPSLHPAVDEALGLRPAYQRQVAASGGRTVMGRLLNEETLAQGIGKLVEIANGADLDSVGLDGDEVRTLCFDVRAFYEEAGTALAEHVPAARQIETWIYHHTEAGKLMLAASEALKDAGVERAIWYYMRPSTQA